MSFWHWFIISGLLFIVEITTLTTFFLFFGVATFIMGVLTFILPNLSTIPQSVLFGILSVVAMFLGYYFFKKNMASKNLKPDVNSSRMTQYIGKTFKLATASTAGVAKVKIGDTEWRVMIDNARAGDVVLITGVKSTSFIAEMKIS
jgi:membrane protein implicated in regulation of membrane protease activity